MMPTVAPAPTTQALVDRIEAGEIDPSLIITHNRPLEEGPELYKTFRDKKDGCHKGSPQTLRAFSTRELANVFVPVVRTVDRKV